MALTITLATQHFFLHQIIFLMKTLQTTLLFMLLGLMMTGANAQISSNLALEYNANGVISAARYVAGNYGDTSQEATFLQQLLTNDSSHHFLLVSSKTDALGWTNRKYQQYYKGIRVYGGEYLTHSLGGRVKNVSGHFMPVQLTNPNAQITDTAAINISLSNIGASEYAWQDSSIEAYLRVSRKDSNATYYPKPELVIAPKELTATRDKLVWVFKVAATDPTDELLVMVDAITGALVKKKSMVCNSNFQDTAYTKYSGTLPILTNFRKSGGGHILKELRALGTSGDSVEIHTYDNKGYTFYNLSNATEIVNIDTISTTSTKIWTTPNWAGFSQDQQALDAHAANEKIIDYWYQVHQRKSYDDSLGPVNGYIHVSEKIGQQYNNAAWLGTRGDMAYGDGDGLNKKPSVSLDICAHEIGHGVCQYTAKLDFAYSEASGLNEGFSDIWAVCIEKWANWGGNKKNWLFGEEVTILDSCIRNLKEPKKDKTPSPDCYYSPLWLKTVGQHYLAGVLRRWFYLLTEGGSGVNDLNNTYAVRGVGIDTAAAIAYRLECNLVSSSGYHDARTVSINQAKNLYGDSSYVIDAIKNAWYAVGVDSVVAIPQCLTTKPTVITSIGSDTVFNGGVYFIPNSLGIDWSVTFNNATVYVGERAALYLLNGSKLAINGSRFTTCQGQWRGILMELNAEVSIDGSLATGRSSLIENADTAIALDHQLSNYSSNGNIIAVNNTIFNRNKIGISIANYTSETLTNYPFQIKNTLFTSRKIAEDSSTVWPNVATVKNSGSASAAYPATPLSYDAPYISNSTYPNAFLKDTTNGTTQYPKVGILLNNVAGYDTLGNRGGIVIGNDGANSTTIFDNLGIGISALQTNITVRNCTFQNPQGDGIGIDINNSIYQIQQVPNLGLGQIASLAQNFNDYTADISTTSPNSTPNNAFFDMKTAMKINSGISSNVAYCDIRSSQDYSNYTPDDQKIGILVGSNNYNNITVDNNQIYNVCNAIIAEDGFIEKGPRGVAFNYGTLTITNNKILDKNSAFSGGTGKEYVKNAVSVTPMLGAGRANVVCTGNQVSNVYNGLLFSGLENSNASILNNTITLVNDNGTSSSSYFGISLEGGNSNVTLENNSVTGSFDLANQTGSKDQTGILLSMQSNATVQCNQVYKNKHGFRFYGSNPQTKWWDNEMVNNNLYGLTVEEGFIGTQGINDPTANGGTGHYCPTNNSWSEASTQWDPGKKQYMTNAINSDLTQSTLVVLNQPKLNPNDSWNSSDPTTPGYKYTISDGTLETVNSEAGSCDRCLGHTSYFSSNPPIDGILEEIAQGVVKIPADEAEERLKVMQQQLYEMIKSDPSYSGNLNLQQFIYTNQLSSLEIIHLIGKNLQEGKMQAAKLSLSNWDNSNDDRVDESFRYYYAWITKIAESPDWQPEPEEMNKLYDYANRCPLKDGVVVYAFRNLYNAYTKTINKFENNCDGQLGSKGIRQQKQFIRLKPKPIKEVVLKTASNIYPNPADKFANIGFEYINHIIVLDLNGKVSATYNGVGLKQMNTSQLSNGVYIVKAIGTNGTQNNSKLIIQHK